MAATLNQIAVPNQNQWSSVIPLYGVADWYLDCLETVRRLGDMPDGWDAYGSPAITVRAIIAMNYLLSVLSSQRVLAPHIAPVSGGGLQLEWVYGNRSLELEIRPSGNLEYLVTDGDQMSTGAIPNWTRVLPLLIDWLRTGALR